MHSVNSDTQSENITSTVTVMTSTHHAVVGSNNSTAWYSISYIYTSVYFAYLKFAKFSYRIYRNIYTPHTG